MVEMAASSQDKILISDEFVIFKDMEKKLDVLSACFVVDSLKTCP